MSDGPLLELSWCLPVQTLQRYCSHSGIQKDGFGRHSCKGIYKSQRTGQPEKQIASGHSCPLCGGLRAKRMTNKADDRSKKVRLTHKKGRKNIRKARRGQWIRTEGALRSTFKSASTGFEGSSLAADFSEPKLGEMKDTAAWQGKGAEKQDRQKTVQRAEGNIFQLSWVYVKEKLPEVCFHRDAVFNAINWLKALCW